MFVKIQSVNSIWQVCAAADRAHRKQTAAASRRSPHSIFWQVLMSRWHKKHSTIHINHLIQTKSREELALCFTGCRLNLFSLTRRQKLDFYAPINDLHLHFIYIYISIYLNFQYKILLMSSWLNVRPADRPNVPDWRALRRRQPAGNVNLVCKDERGGERLRCGGCDTIVTNR